MSLHFSGPQLPLQADRLWGRTSEPRSVLPQGTLMEYACSLHERPASHVRSSRSVTQLCRALSSWTGAHLGSKCCWGTTSKIRFTDVGIKTSNMMKAFFLRILTIACICYFLAKKNIDSAGCNVSMSHWMSFFLLWWWHESMLNASASTLCCLPPVAEKIPATH